MPKPVIVELAGLPAAGKTSAAELLAARLRHSGVSCQLIDEAAQQNPLQESKCEWSFNLWSSCRTLMDLLEAQAEPKASVIVLDRGLIDAQCWMLWFRRHHKIDAETYAATRDFLRAPMWAGYTSLVVELQVRYETALRRRHGDVGRIFNKRNFADLGRAYELTLLDRQTRHRRTRLARIDTNELSLSSVVARIQSLLPERLREGGHGESLVFDDQDAVEVIEAKSTNWDRIKAENVRATALRHAREFGEVLPKAHSAFKPQMVLVYPEKPHKAGRADAVTEALAAKEIRVSWRDLV